MFEELIEKIESLKIKVGQTSDDPESAWQSNRNFYEPLGESKRCNICDAGVYNSAIIMVIKTIKEFAQPQDKPNCAGVWWKSDYTTPGVHAVLVSENYQWYTEFSGNSYKVEVSDWCKWYKAIMPEVAK